MSEPDTQPKRWQPWTPPEMVWIEDGKIHAYRPSEKGWERYEDGKWRGYAE